MCFENIRVSQAERKEVATYKNFPERVLQPHPIQQQVILLLSAKFQENGEEGVASTREGSPLGRRRQSLGQMVAVDETVLRVAGSGPERFGMDPTCSCSLTGCSFSGVAGRFPTVVVAAGV